MTAWFGCGDGEGKVKNYYSIKDETLWFKQFQTSVSSKAFTLL